mgnify:CR=1 FL=1
MKNYLLLILFSFICIDIYSQNKYLFPINTNSQNYLSGTMGELRGDHFHMGIDIKTFGKTGYPVFASENGYIERIKVTESGYGKAIYIKHLDGKKTIYAHLNMFNKMIDNYVTNYQYRKKSFSINIYPGKKFYINKGEVIAYSGNTGSSSGPHLHFELRDSLDNVYDPLKLKFNEIKEMIKEIKLDIIQDKKGEFNIIEEDDYIDDESKEFLMKRINDDIRISVYKRIKELGLTSEHLENKEVVNYIIDDKKYKKMERGRFLFMDSKEIELLNFKRKKKDLRMINAKKGDFKRMEQIEFLEDMFKIKRFDINNIKYRKLKAVKNKLIKNIPKLIIFFEGDASTKRLKDNMSSRINSIKEDYQLKKWLADIYNSYDRFITYKIIKKENNNVFEGFKISSKKKLLYETLFKTTILSMN